MVQWMDLLRGPALGVVAMIILLAGVILITAFAALVAQVSLLLRLKPWNLPEKKEGGTGNSGYSQRAEADFSGRETQWSSSSQRERSPSEHSRRGQLVVVEPNANEVVDAIWWEVVK